MIPTKIAHLLLAHKSPKQVARLTKILADHPNAAVFIHVDAKSEILPFVAELSGVRKVHFLKKRVSVNWGGYSMVEATIRLLETAFKKDDFQYFNLLSGEDYLLKSPADIHSFLGNHHGKSFVEYQQRDTLWWQSAQVRFTKYYFTDINLPGIHAIERLVNFFLPKRKPLQNISLVGGSQWMTLYRDHVQYIIEQAIFSRKLIQFFKYSWAPDEFFFQTILFNSPYRNELINNNLRYIAWEEGKASPKTTTPQDIQTVIQSDKLFARKFDESRYPELLNELDRLRVAPGHLGS